MTKAVTQQSALIAFIYVIGCFCFAMSEPYNYPFTDKYVATVVGTPPEYQADLPKKSPLEPKEIVIFPDREVPDAFFYNEELRYSIALQETPSPLIFLIAGTGAAHNTKKNEEMAKAFYKEGFHIISISSPTYTNFIVAASETGVPGHPQRDASDLYRVMKQTYEEVKEDIDVTEFHMTGYSLGGFNSAFVSLLDEDEKYFNFKKVLLINPPVSLYNSTSLLDRMINNIPGGEDNFGLFFQELVNGFTKIYKQSANEIDEDFIYEAYKGMDLKDEELAALIGVSFRLSASSLAFTSDVITDFGYVKPKEVRIDRHSNLTPYRRVVNRLGFTDYYHEFFYPFYKEMDGLEDRMTFINEASLVHISDYLQKSDKISVMHNQDDVILAPGEIDFFHATFGDRAKIYPYGGHCGNMSYRDNVTHMINIFKR